MFYFCPLSFQLIFRSEKHIISNDYRTQRMKKQFITFIAFLGLILATSSTAQTVGNLKKQTQTAISKRTKPANAKADSAVSKATKKADAYLPGTGSLVKESAENTKNNAKAKVKGKTQKMTSKINNAAIKADAKEQKAYDAIHGATTNATKATITQ